MYELFSVDDHIVEPADVWSSRVPQKYRDRAPRVIEEAGREFWVYEDQRTVTMGLNAVAGKPREQWSLEPSRFDDMIPGCYDPKARALDMLSQGVLASVCFPTLPRFGGMLFNSFQDKELASVCVQAWNDFILDEWCPAGPEGMFVPMIICQVWDPELAAAEVRRCVDKGAKALCFVENPVPDGLPGFHGDHWDPLFRAVTETDIPVCMHIGSSGFMPVTDPAATLAVPIALGNMCGMLAMVNLLLSPVLHKFPTMQVAFSEAGIGWIPAVLERADRQTERQAGWSGANTELKPSELFRRNVYACMVEEPLGLTFHQLIGADRILAETDYPHSDSTYPKTQESCAEVFGGMPQDVVDLVTHDNAQRLFKWSMADEALLSSPEVTSWRSTLEADPYAAMSDRHSVGGVDRSAAGERTCEERVLLGSNYTLCGKRLDVNGVCEAGHVNLVTT